MFVGSCLATKVYVGNLPGLDHYKNYSYLKVIGVHSTMCVHVCVCVCVFVGSCLAAKVFIGNLPAMGRGWVCHYKVGQ